MEIYRKPTATDITMNKNSCHPKEHKLAAYRSWIHRLWDLPISETNRQHELNTTLNIALNNGYKTQDIMQIYNKSINQCNTSNYNINQDHKWITFIYTGNYTRISKITNLFKDTNLKIAFKTTTNLNNLLNTKTIPYIYDQSGIYKLTCQICQKVYIGQMGRCLNIRYKKHIGSIRYNNDDSAFAQHILNTGHQYGPREQIMEMVEKARKGKIMNIKENFYIYLFNYANNLIQEQKQIKAGDRQNSLFDFVVKYTPPQRLHH
jgi:hypothetical protein